MYMGAVDLGEGDDQGRGLMGSLIIRVLHPLSGGKLPAPPFSQLFRDQPAV